MSEFGNQPRADRNTDGAEKKNVAGGPGKRGCTFARADLKAYLDGEIGFVRHGAVRWHLARCGECREEMAWLTRLGEDMRDLERAVPRPELRARILASLPDGPPAGTAARPAPRAVRARQAMPSLRWGAVGFAAFGAIAAFAGAGVIIANRAPHTGVSRIAGAPARPESPAALSPAAPREQITGADRHVAGPATRKDPFKPAGAQVAVNPAAEPNRDNTYDEANRLFEKRWAAEQRQETAHYRQMLRSAGLTGAVALPKDGGPVRLALAVKDVRAAREHLQVIAAAFRAPAPGAPPTVAPARTEDSRQAASKSGSEPVIVALDVPAGSVVPLMRNLEQMGRLGIYASSTGDPQFRKSLSDGLHLRALRPDALPEMRGAPGTGVPTKSADADKRVRITIELVPASRAGH